MSSTSAPSTPAPATPAVALRAEHITVAFAGGAAVTDISFELPGGATLAIMGPSGCGKSTLLKACAGIVPVSSGRITVLGTDILNAAEPAMRTFRRQNGFVFQDAALWQNLTARQNLRLPVEFHFPKLGSDEIDDRISRLLGEVGFSESLEVRPAQLSAGERKIVSFVRGLVTDPEIIFLDEPTTFVDGETAERLIRKMKFLKDARKTMLIATHNASVTSLLADFILVMKHGRALTFGSTDAVVHSTDPEVVAILSDVLSETATYATEILTLLDRGGDEFFGTDSSLGEDV